MKPSFKNFLGFFYFATTYALRSLGRNKRRTFLTLSTVALSCCVSYVADRYTDAIMKIWREASADTGDGHAQIHRTGYWQKQEGISTELSLSNEDKLSEFILENKDSKAVAKRLRFEGIVTNGVKSVYFVGIGIQAKEEEDVSPRLFNPKNDRGSFVSSEDPNGIVIGKGLAETLNVNLGDSLSLLVSTANASTNAMDVTVRGIVYVPLPSFSKRALYMNLDRAQRMLRFENRFTELVVRLQNLEMTKNFVNQNKHILESKGFEIRGWWDIQPLIPKVELIWRSIIGLVCALLFLSASLSVANMIYMLVSERTIEIGTLLALGATSQRIKILFTLESFILGTFGSLTGVIAGNFIIWLMSIHGVIFDNPFGSGSILVFPQISLQMSGMIFLLGIFICSLAAIFPAHKASLIEPVKAFRGQQ